MIDRLQQAEGTEGLASLAPGVLLTGGAGCGKSMALLHIVHWAKQAGWLVYYVANARTWIHGQFWEYHPCALPNPLILSSAFAGPLRSPHPSLST